MVSESVELALVRIRTIPPLECRLKTRGSSCRISTVSRDGELACQRRALFVPAVTFNPFVWELKHAVDLLCDLGRKRITLGGGHIIKEDIEDLRERKHAVALIGGRRTVGEAGDIERGPDRLVFVASGWSAGLLDPARESEKHDRELCLSPASNDRRLAQVLQHVGAGNHVDIPEGLPAGGIIRPRRQCC